MIPGRILHRLAATVCSAKTLERVVEPAIADLQKEHIGASASHFFRRARILLNGYGAILKVIVMCALTVSIPTDEERHLVLRALVWSVALIVVVTALLMLPPLYAFDHSIRGWYAAITLVPQALPLAIPIGVAFGMAFGLTARLTLGTAKTILLGALAASVVSFGTLVWAMPAGNQAFREMVFELESTDHDGPSAGLQKGYNELTFTELRREIARFSTEGDFRGVRQAIFSFHLRFSLAAATLVLAGFLLAAPVSHRALRGFLAFLTCFVYWVLLYTGEVLSVHQIAIPGVAGAWLPNIVLAAATLIIVSSRSSRLRGSLRPAP